MDARNRLAFALDYPNLEQARSGAALVFESVGVLKVGLELFIEAGPEAARIGAEFGCGVFLDLKLHDIEKTVERAVGAACGLGVKYLTVHASGGPRMLEAAAKRADQEGTGLCVLGVTVLTSLDESDLKAVGVEGSLGNQVARLARLARDCGLGGLVCSSSEVAHIRTIIGSGMTLVTPGIRPPGTFRGDQKRVGTPEEAIANGSDLLVVGRPIRDAQSPKEAARSILQAVTGAIG